MAARGLPTALVVVCLWWNAAAIVTEYTTKDYCLKEKFQASCPDGGLVLIDSALYGRMTFGRCVQRDYGYIGCSVDVTRILANKCSARQSCEVVNFETVFAAYNRCPGDLKSYLQVSYYCKKTNLPLDPEQCNSGYVEPLPPSFGESGYLTPTERRWGTPSCPWRIRIRSGQRINLTLHDYSDFGIPSSQQPRFCNKYLVVSDGGKEKTIMSCNHQLRSRTVYLSATNDIRVYFTVDPNTDDNIHFLLEFRAEGCPLPSLPANSYVLDNGDGTFTVQCNYSMESWKIQCENGRWQGNIGNCTARAAQHTEHLVPLGISIIIIVAVALLVCTSVLVVGFFVFYCRRRRRGRRLREEKQYFDAHSNTLSHANVLNTRTKHASLEKSRTPYSPLTKTRTIRTPTRGGGGAGGGEYTQIWEMKHPIPVATPEVPKTHAFRCDTVALAKSSPTMTSARFPMLPERNRDRVHATRRSDKPTFSTFKPGADPYGIPPFRGETSQESCHSNASSPLYFEIDTQRRKATNHYST